ncbi:MAG: hypothetical protein KI793_30080 [Rivularia sp. (in: Bacteria)]|nr:hypothetical protein [Rivularia sp. MS3]
MGDYFENIALNISIIILCNADLIGSPFLSKPLGVKPHRLYVASNWLG